MNEIATIVLAINDDEVTLALKCSEIKKQTTGSYKIHSLKQRKQ